MKTLSEIRSAVRSCAARYGVERVYLFGSYARGEAGHASDIDLRVDKGDVRGLRFASLLLDLEDALGTSVDLISSKAMSPEFRSEIAKDEVLLYDHKFA